MSAKQVLIDESPYPASASMPPWENPGRWPASWVHHDLDSVAPYVHAYRIKFNLATETTTLVHVTADERYALYLDGELIGRGSERGDAYNWFFESFELSLAAGDHTLVAQVWRMDDKAPVAQMSVKPGFFLCPSHPELLKVIGTGEAPWEAKRLSSFKFVDYLSAWGTGLKTDLAPNDIDHDWEQGSGSGWIAAHKGDHGLTSGDSPEFFHQQFLRPATLLPQINTRWMKGHARHAQHVPAGPTAGLTFHAKESDATICDDWTKLLHGDHALRVAAHQRIRVLIDLDDYLCAYPQVITKGGAGSSVRIHWEEALYTAPKTTEKGNRNEIEGKYFYAVWHAKDGVGDIFHPDGRDRCSMMPLWWECGRYVEIVVETADEPLTIEHLHLWETRYPLERESSFECSDHRFAEIDPLMLRVLQMCAHETYFDCPFYEQLMYIGDTRLEVLATYCTTADDRLPRKALKMFDASRQPSGISASRYPSRIRQTIPPFSLWYIGMVHDFMMWRGDKAFVQTLMTGVRTILDWYRSHAGSDGLVSAPPGWNFIDWVPEWKGGCPPGANETCGVLNLKLAWILRQAAELETWVGEPELAVRHLAWSVRVSESLREKFWSKERGMFADDLHHKSFSEHAQCLALLAGWLRPSEVTAATQGLLEAKDLHRATIYFSYYLLETYGKVGRMDRFMHRLQQWFDLPALGMKTVLEHPEPSRSDCHAWGAHPLVHYYTTILGVRPSEPGFAKYEVKPNLGALQWANGSFSTPRGRITVKATPTHVEHDIV